MIITDDFNKAVKDYLYLLENQYPQKAVLKIIGDRYALNGTQRTILYRGITTKNNSLNRKQKLAGIAEVLGSILHIDTYNVLITIGNYLNGNILYISTDYLLRDASEIHGKAFRKNLIDRALDLIFNYFKIINVSGVRFYIDRPVSNSGKLNCKINELIQKNGLSGESKTVDSPDYVLKKQSKGYCCTSDSAIIDNGLNKTFDLAHFTLKHNFKPSFIDLTI